MFRQDFTTDLDGEKDLAHIFAANEQWCTDTKENHPEFFDYLGAGHKPKCLWIGCSDARIPPNVITGQPPGDIFVHRNIANLVVNTDMNLMSVIQYAVDYLNVKHIMVVGHYDCGGIRAAMTKNNHGSPLENWIRNIRDVMRLHKSELTAIEDPEARHHRLVELNVMEQCINVFKTHSVQRRRVETYRQMKRKINDIEYAYPRVHGMVFHPANGKLIPLPVKDLLMNHVAELREIYEVYTPGQTTMDMP
jgi:carbonic anhydrase